MAIHDVVPLINSGNNWITLSIMVASWIRLIQGPQVFEVDFLSILLWFQLALAIARCVTIIKFLYWPDPPLDHLESHERHERLTDAEGGYMSMLFTGINCLGAFATALFARYPDKVQYKVLAAISRFCAFENDLAVPLQVDPSPPSHIVAPNSGTFDTDISHTFLQEWPVVLLFGLAILIFFIAFSAVGWLALHAFQIGFVYMIAVMCYIARRAAQFLSLCAWATGYLWLKLSPGLRGNLKELGSWARKAMWIAIALFPGAVWLTLCVRLLTTMQGARNDMKMALGEQYQDSYWGFGQVTILVMLVPQTVDVVGRIISEFRVLCLQLESQSMLEFRPKRNVRAERATKSGQFSVRIQTILVPALTN
jgi:hypothetical protein